MSTGTPGPWHVEPRATKYPDLIEYDVSNGQFNIAQRLDCPHDAALIAAAPDLLRALKRWERLAIYNDWSDYNYHDPDGTGWISDMRAAIAKATLPAT